MKIGILEIMPVGHYTLVDSIARIYLSSSEFEVVVFTNSKGKEVLTPLFDEFDQRIEIIEQKKNISTYEFLHLIDNYKLNKLYIVTLEKYFSEINKHSFQVPLFLFIHNIEDWFRISFFESLYKFVTKSSRYLNQMVYHFKCSFIYPVWKKNILKKVFNSGGKLVVLNANIKKELAKYIAFDSIEVIPFSVYNPNIIDSSIENKLIRICIPGMVDNLRRNYLEVLQIIENDIEIFKFAFELELLGGLNYSGDAGKIIEKADSLIKQGFKVVYYNKPFIPLSEFDLKLAKANIILGNMNVVLNKYSSYGKTKESGIIFTMIRTAKPGILPKEYDLLDELKSSTIQFNDYCDLRIQLIEIAKDPNIIKELSKNALENSKRFSSSNILQTINY